jgi:16S rRNA (cytidine1402-2'-O)-methyltransferase
MRETKRQDLPGQSHATETFEPLPPDLPPGLWVVATPIGNLRDLTVRGREALANAERIYCEDTRRTSRLLAALGVRRPLERLDAHASPARVAAVAAELAGLAEQGRGAALVTDAGTPAISDPGARLVARARELGVRVTPVPGCSAVVAALSVAGWENTRFTFRGFFPRKEGERSSELSGAELVGGACLWFESPERVVGALEFLARAHPTAQAFAGKELTKAYERIFGGTAEEVRSQVRAEVSREGALGEWVIGVVLNQADRKDESWERALRCCLAGGISTSEAARLVSQHFGVAKNEAYSAAVSASFSAYSKKNEEGG